MTINFLDRTLLHFKEIHTGEDENNKVKRFTNDEYPTLQKALKKLEKDGYLYSFKAFVGTPAESLQYEISFDGLLALESTPCIIWKDKPYRWQAFKENLIVWWNVGKVIVIFLNALFLLILAILAYLKPA